MDQVFIVDDSWSSMLLDLSLTRVQLSIANFKQVDSLWAETRSAFAGVVRTCVPYDRDGIDLHFFNAYGAENLTTTEEVMKLFNGVKPEKGKLTPTATALERVLLPYIRRLELAHSNRMPNLGGQAIKPLNVIILTDGVPFPLPKENPEALIVVGHRFAYIGCPGYSMIMQLLLIDRISQDDSILSEHQVIKSACPSFRLAMIKGFVLVFCRDRPRNLTARCRRQAARALTYLDTKLKKRYRIRDMVDTVAAPLKVGDCPL